MPLLKKCKSCNTYTMQNNCPNCRLSTSTAHPVKYSKEDKYAIYRRKELFPQLFKA